MKKITLLLAILISFTSFANQRENLWPKNKMPDRQGHQVAAMRFEVQQSDFNPKIHTEPYLDWYDAPKNPTGACVIMLSGGSYQELWDHLLLEIWSKRFTELGIQCVALVYRTPRPVGLPIYQTAWEDGQRAVRMVRSEAKKRGYNPEQIGTVSQSAGSHLALLLGTTSQTNAYERIDKIDDTPCHINWALLDAPAYCASDSETGTMSIRQGYGPDVKLSGVFKFDEKTCPMCFCQGGADIYAPTSTTLVYRRLREMNIPSEIHLFADKPHQGALGLERQVEFLRSIGVLGELKPEEKLMDRFNNDNARAIYAKENVWPEGGTPDFQGHQCVPYIEWHIPANLTTKSIQIIYSGGSYQNNDPDGFEAAPARRYLNEKGMAVVTLKYRTPRPNNLPKHITAWEDLQRAIRIVRSKAVSYGLDPDNIGIMGNSAGGHLTLMGVTSSLHQAYLPIDDIDKLPCNVQWGVAIYPAYVLSDGVDGHNTNGGNLDCNRIVDDFSFDLKTAPMLFVHGSIDQWSAMGSVKCWEKMRAMGIQSELHTLVGRDHCFQREASPETGSYTYLDRIWDFLTAKGFVICD